jgi:hypothetical protein
MGEAMSAVTMRPVGSIAEGVMTGKLQAVSHKLNQCKYLLRHINE